MEPRAAFTSTSLSGYSEGGTGETNDNCGYSGILKRAYATRFYAYSIIIPAGEFNR